jgi:ribonuclease H2 subunit A
MNEDDPIEVLYRRAGKPLEDRSETVRVVKALHGDSASSSSSTSSEKQPPRPPLSNVHGDGPLLLSDIPASCKQPGVVIGIDEAGRGSVLGPMIYGAAFWNRNQAETIPKGFNDSKQLSEDTRTKLFGKILNSTPELGFAIRVLHASEISRNMLRKEPYNLNQMSHDSAIEIIQKLLEAGVQIETAYIDTVGNPESYKARLDRTFPGITFVVESKADANYAPCSAGSVGKSPFSWSSTWT